MLFLLSKYVLCLACSIKSVIFATLKRVASLCGLALCVFRCVCVRIVFLESVVGKQGGSLAYRKRGEMDKRTVFQY